MKKNRTKEYLEKMRPTIIADLKDDRHRSAIAGSINVTTAALEEWMLENGLKDLYGEPTSPVKPLQD
jgi:hypothetical protein